MAAVVCCTFFLSWLPYATVSLMSALISSDDLEAKRPLQDVVEGFAGGALGSANATQMLGIPPLLNWTTLEEIYNNPEHKWREVNDSIASPSDVFSPPLVQKEDPMTSSTQTTSPLPPVVTLIPAMLAKSHCMLNPIIYQMMSREFRDDVFEMVFSRERSRRRRGERGRGHSNESKNHKASAFPRPVNLHVLPSSLRIGQPLPLPEPE